MKTGQVLWFSNHAQELEREHNLLTLPVKPGRPSHSSPVHSWLKRKEAIFYEGGQNGVSEEANEFVRVMSAQRRQRDNQNLADWFLGTLPLEVEGNTTDTPTHPRAAASSCPSQPGEKSAPAGSHAQGCNHANPFFMSRMQKQTPPPPKAVRLCPCLAHLGIL